MSEESQFLKDLGIEPEEKPLEDKPAETVEPEKEEQPRDEEGLKKNRAMRRLEQRLQAERESSIRLSEQVRLLTEASKVKEEAGDDHLKKVEAIFGTNTPEKLAATNLLKEALQGMTQQAKEETLREWESRSEAESGAQREADKEVDSMLERVEDDYGLDMSNESVRNGFLTLMERMSPKYDDGNVKEFADPDAVAEAYMELQKRDSSSRAKELASRGMIRSGQSQPSKLQDDAVSRFMRDNGLEWNL